MKKTLLLGTDPSAYPIIRIEPRAIPKHVLDDLEEYTHVIFTSKNAVSIFFKKVPKLEKKMIIALGKATAKALVAHGCPATFIADEESQEGVIALLRPLDLDDAYILFPHSALARSGLESFFRERGIRHQAFALYDTVFQSPEPIPNLNDFDEIVFTSPSTVHAFIKIFGAIPKGKKLRCQGPVTEEALRLFS